MTLSPDRTTWTPGTDDEATVRRSDRAHVFHSWSAQARIDPMPIARALGSSFWDYEGRRYLDFSSQLVNVNIGYQHPVVVAAIKAQAKMYTAMGNLPTLGSVQQQIASSDPFLKPFVDTLKAGTKFVPSSASWSKIDAQGVLPTAVQQIATGGKSADAALSDASDQMNKAFG